MHETFAAEHIPGADIVLRSSAYQENNVEVAEALRLGIPVWKREDAWRFLGIYPGGYHLLDWLVAVPVLALAVWASVRLRPTYAVYVWASILAPLAFIFASRPLMSFPRFALPLFPIFWGAARLTEGRRVRRELAVAASATILGVLLLLFVAWYYVF